MDLPMDVARTRERIEARRDKRGNADTQLMTDLCDEVERLQAGQAAGNDFHPLPLDVTNRDREWWKAGYEAGLAGSPARLAAGSAMRRRTDVETDAT